MVKLKMSGRMPGKTTEQETEMVRLMKTARMGFEVVPVAICRNVPGLLYMDGKGLRFEPTGPAELTITWEEFDAGKKL